MTVRQQSPQIRQSIERLSLRPAAYLRHLPRWLPPVAIAALFVGGLAVRGWGGAGLLQSYQIEFRRTQNFCKKLQELNLLEPMRAQMTLDSGERMALTGFMAVSRARPDASPAIRLRSAAS